jgi:5-oxopent-3-ene-1,2,5-tricarboxylate decarboxylase/2-hydroxyhepta-2,4-diene-1,7-dioate isomerase
MHTFAFNTEIAISPFRLSGLVYGTLLNDVQSIGEMADAATRPPYKALPHAPILYLKSRNTLVNHGDTIFLPDGVSELVMRPSLGIIVGRTICRVTAANALDHVAGYTIVNDVCIRHESFYRPSVRFLAADTFCAVSNRVTAASELANPDAVDISVCIAGRPAYQGTTSGKKRNVAQLLEDVSEFMTLNAGDVLMLGCTSDGAIARAGESVQISMSGLGQLENTLMCWKGKS